MYFEEALKNELESIPILNNKVFALTAIEGSKTPYLVYMSSEGIQEKDLNGYSIMTEVDVDLHILADEYPQLKDITRQVITKVKSFQSQVIGGTDGVYIYDFTYEKPTEQFIPELYQYLSVIPIKLRF